jgi:hypothetical protein
VFLSLWGVRICADLASGDIKDAPGALLGWASVSAMAILQQQSVRVNLRWSAGSVTMTAPISVGGRTRWISSWI